jgi:hypothetical protein
MKKGLVVLLFLLLITAITAVYVWNKPFDSASNEIAVFNDTPEKLTEHFFLTPDSLEQAWENKVITIEGIPTRIENESVILFETPNGTVSCAPSPGIGLPLPNTKIRIHGFFSGYDAGLPGFDDFPSSLFIHRCEWLTI